MIVAVGDQKYVVKFFHETVGEPLLTKKGKPIHNSGKRYTKCTIREITKEKKDFLGVGYAKCHQEDPFIKETGRVISLTKALEDTGLNTTSKLAILVAYKSRKPIKN